MSLNFFRTGKSVIADALTAFNEVTKQLDEGIKLSNQECKQHSLDLETARKTFETKEKTLNTKILNATAEADKATIVRDNITRLLGN